MNGDGGLRYPNWDYYRPSLKENLGLQLNSSIAERDMKPFFVTGGFVHPRDRGIAGASLPMDFVPDRWSHLNRDCKIHPVVQVNHHPSYGSCVDALGAHSLHMMQAPELPMDDHAPTMMEDHMGDRNNTPPKKRPQARLPKSPKPKKPKKVPAPRDDGVNGSILKGKGGKKSPDMVINGIDLDIRAIPTPVCSCTGTPQQCYRWGVGGWQSACCTTTMSVYPLPVSTKRRGARIAGRKMSQGAFKKVLEKLAGEGFNLANPIDLRTFWAKHGTNKFVTIR